MGKYSFRGSLRVLSLFDIWNLPIHDIKSNIGTVVDMAIRQKNEMYSENSIIHLLGSTPLQRKFIYRQIWDIL